MKNILRMSQTSKKDQMFLSRIKLAKNISIIHSKMNIQINDPIDYFNKLIETYKKTLDTEIYKNDGNLLIDDKYRFFIKLDSIKISTNKSNVEYVRCLKNEIIYSDELTQLVLNNSLYLKNPYSIFITGNKLLDKCITNYNFYEELIILAGTNIQIINKLDEMYEELLKLDIEHKLSEVEIIKIMKEDAMCCKRIGLNKIISQIYIKNKEFIYEDVIKKLTE